MPFFGGSGQWQYSGTRQPRGRKRTNSALVESLRVQLLPGRLWTLGTRWVEAQMVLCNPMSYVIICLYVLVRSRQTANSLWYCLRHHFSHSQLSRMVSIRFCIWLDLCRPEEETHQSWRKLMAAADEKGKAIAAYLAESGWDLLATECYGFQYRWSQTESLSFVISPGATD